VETPVRSDDWPVILADTFDGREQLGESWQISGGGWRIDRGTLKGTLHPFPSIPGFNNALVVPKLPLPSLVEVRFDCWISEPLNCEVKFHDRLGRTGLCAMFAGASSLAFNRGEKGALVIVESSGGFHQTAVNGRFRLEPNRRYRLRVLREPRRLTLFADGEQVLTARVPNLDVPFLHLQGSFGQAGGVIHLDNVEVRAPATTAVERQAVGLVEGAFARLKVKADVIADLQRAAGVEPAVRQAALAIAGRCVEDANTLNNASYVVARRRDATAAEYQRALRQAEAASRLARDNPAVLNTLGIAQYRAGRYQEALATWRRCEQLNRDHPADLAFLAMTHHRLGQKEQARAALARLREVLKRPGVKRDAEVEGFLREAEELIEGAK
jgi:hypothetical protein